MKTKEDKAIKGVYPKLLHIQQQIDRFIYDDKTFNYKYVTGSQVLAKIRPLMNELGLLLKQEIIEIQNERQDYTTSKGAIKSEILSKVMQRFTWVDAETGEKDENLFGANGQNDWDKGVGSALTYGERYFMMKYFHVPTDEDDPDTQQKRRDSYSYQQSPPPPAQKPTLVQDSKQWIALIERIENGTIKDLVKLKETMVVSAELETKLKSILLLNKQD